MTLQLTPCRVIKLAYAWGGKTAILGGFFILEFKDSENNLLC